MMKVGIMQPYIFPYIGYFQLINAVNKFIVYDDVNFIKQGWINRNKILLQNREFLFTIPLQNASSFKLIKDTKVDEKAFESWKKIFYKNIEQAYKKTLYYEIIFSIIRKVLESSFYISALATQSILECVRYLNIETEIVQSSMVYNNMHLNGHERVIDICVQTKASEYINAAGGTELYNKEDFKRKHIVLNFLKPNEIRYNQNKENFIPCLSIIDIMMFNSKEEIKKMLYNFNLV